jgi:aminoglycoside phosphotransferase family enzyme
MVSTVHGWDWGSKISTSRVSYEIGNRLYSQSARLLFARQYENVSEPVVIKILRSYRDPRYRLKSRAERQSCQLEALEWNSRFAKDIYIGLASVLHETNNTITLGKIIRDVTEKASLNSDHEYALIMKRLPEDRQLSYLLDYGSKSESAYYAQLLTQCVVEIHKSLTPLNEKEEQRWGNYTALREKLQENLMLVKPLFEEKTIEAYSSYNWFRNHFFDLFRLSRVKKTFASLQKSLTKVVETGHYEEKFAQRVKSHSIYRCHGDLKAPNIWIVENNLVQILDTIDFNPMFCHIDVLSDFAMLVIDIQVRTKSSALADSMIEDYLREMKQTDAVSRAVLAYYLYHV